MLRKRRLGIETSGMVIRVLKRKSEKSGRKVSRLNLRRGKRGRIFAENKNKHLEILFNQNCNNDRSLALGRNKNKYLIAQVVAKVMQFDTASQNYKDF